MTQKPKKSAFRAKRSEIFKILEIEIQSAMKRNVINL